MSTGQALFPLGIEPGIFRAHPWKELLTTGAQTTWLFDALLIKSNVVDDRMIMSIWGDTPCGYSYRPSSGASGGLVTVWDSSRVEVWSTMSLGSILVIKGRLLLSSEEFVICNVYAPIDTTAKREVWERLSKIVLNNSDICVCVCGDFNAVRSWEERKGRGSVFRQAEADMFNKFIADSSLIDLPLCGRLFSWYRGDGVSMSRLDRFLLSEKWSEAWPNCIQVAYQRGLSDHVPLMLHVDEANWGPRPLRMLKCWADLPSYGEFVRDKWSSINLTSWGGFVLRKKLKMLKAELKVWHNEHSKNLDAKIAASKSRIAMLDSKAKVTTLLDVETEELHALSVNLHSMAQLQNSINRQKSRMNWLQDGDANSKFFHGYMSNRRRSNAINVVNVDGVYIDGVQDIRAAVFNHFSNHYKIVGSTRPSVESLHFCQLSFSEARMILCACWSSFIVTGNCQKELILHL